MKKAGLLSLFLTVAAGVACDSGSDLPNDPLIALLCDEGFILNKDQDGCIPQAIIVVHGIVTDDRSGAPIPGVEVWVMPWKKDPYVTDDMGYFWAEGGTTTDDLVIMYKHPNFEFDTLHVSNPGDGDDFGEYDPDQGHHVIDVSFDLQPNGRNMMVAGTVYAGDAPADGAEVALYDNGSGGYDRYTAMTGPDGKFNFTGVEDSSYTLRVYPFDEDSDGVYDYRFYSDFLSTLSTNTTDNLSNLIAPLVAIQKSLLFSNFIPNTVTGGAGFFSNRRLDSPSSNIILHFGAEVQTDTVEIVLRPYETAGGYGDPMTFTATWSMGDTVLTIDPASDFTADANINSQYSLQIRSLVWADGSVMISQTSNSQLEVLFDVTNTVTRLASPTPSFFFDSRRNIYQTTASVSCDNLTCWLLDADGGFLDGWTDSLNPFTSYNNQFNWAGGFMFTWPHEPGADTYTAYGRRRANDNSADNRSNWYNVTGSFESGGPVDPSVSGTVLMTGVFGGDWGGYFWPDTLDPDGRGALFNGAEVDLAITATDVDGFESPIDPSNVITMSDTTPPHLRNISNEYFGSGVFANSVERGHSLIHKNILIGFGEFMNTGVNPVISITSGNITSVGSPENASWDTNPNPTPENHSAAVALGPYAVSFRGSCTAITCDLFVAGDGDPDSPSDSVCVHDASIFDTGAVFFLNNGGALIQTALTLAAGGVDTVNNTLQFTSPFPNGLGFSPDFDFACATQPAATGNLTNLTAQADPADQTLNLGDASIFYPGEQIILYDTNGDDYEIHTVANVRTGATNEVDIIGAIASTFSAATSFVIPRPLVNEQPFRTTSTVDILDDFQGVAGNDQLQLNPGSFNTADSIMEGDLCHIDIDGIDFTTGDHFFGLVNEVIMLPDPNPGNSLDEADYHITLGDPPAGLPGIPDGQWLTRGVTNIVCLGDSFEVSGAEDTSGNTGSFPIANQFSNCAGTPGCGNFQTGNIFVY